MAVGQFEPVLDWRANADACAELIRRAGRDGTDLLVLPEAALTRVPDRPSRPPEGQPLDGPFVRRLAHAASVDGGNRELTVVVGTLVPTADGRVRNTGVALRGGDVIGSYDKLHLYDAYGARESEHVAGGEGPLLTLEVGGLRVGVMICYDLRFPEMARALALGGVDVIALPAAWINGPHKLQHWRTLCQARAIENGCYVAAAGATGAGRTGHSLIVDPQGVVMSELGRAAGLATAVAGADVLTDARRSGPFMAQRRFGFDPEPLAVANPAVRR